MMILKNDSLKENDENGVESVFLRGKDDGADGDVLLMVVDSGGDISETPT